MFVVVPIQSAERLHQEYCLTQIIKVSFLCVHTSSVSGLHHVPKTHPCRENQPSRRSTLTFGVPVCVLDRLPGYRRTLPL